MDHLHHKDLTPGNNNLWYEYNDSNDVIVFVHGFFSESAGCWLYEDKEDASRNVFWPDLIRDDKRLGTPSQFLGGYYSALDSGGYGFRNCADELFRAMGRPDEYGHPPVMDKGGVVFVCHSMGGIVVRHMLERHREYFTPKRVGLLLIASPSYGSAHADRLAGLARLYNHEQGLHLRWGDVILKDLDADFKDLVDSRKIPNLVGVEACENHFIIHRKWLTDKTVVVTEESAGRYFGAAKLLRGTNHLNVVKPHGLRHPVHELLVDFWRRYSPPKPHAQGKISASMTNAKVPYKEKRWHREAKPTEPKIVSASSLAAEDHSDNLPLQATSFVGREVDIKLVKRLLRKGRIVTLRGVGGVGKSRLALQVASQRVGKYADGVWLVEITALSDSALVVQAIASTLGVREVSGASLAKTLVGHLSTKHLLLVLDNCEHLLHACAHICNDLLNSCPRLNILVTSRELLGIAEEQLYGVPSLSVPELKTAHSMRELARFGAIKLFMDRAVAAQPSFSITTENAPVIAAICQRLDGIPLALVLAAAQLRIMSLAEIATRLDDIFYLPTTTSSATISRHQTLRASIDWSYALLSDQEKSIFSRLAVFAGGWTLSAAEAVGAGENAAGAVIEEWEVADLLTSLVDKSLVVYEEQTAGHSGRSRLLETIRRYAQDRHEESGEAEAVHGRAATWFLNLSEEAEPQLRGPEQEAWFERLETEHDNLRASLSWYERQAGGAEDGLRLAGALWRFWQMRGHLSEGRQWLGKALERTKAAAGGEEKEGSVARAKALNGASNLARIQGDFAVARDLLKEEMTIRQRMGDQEGTATSLNSLGNVAWVQGDYAGAQALHEESLTIYQELADHRGIALTLGNLALVAYDQGGFAVARALYEESLTIYQELADQQGIALTLNGLGLVACGQGDYIGAGILFEDGLTIYRKLGNQLGIAFALGNLGYVAWGQGDYARAQTLYEESLTMRRQYGDQRGIADCLEGMTDVAQGQSQPSRAARLGGAASALRENIGIPRPPISQGKLDRTMVSVRQALGEKAFSAAWDRGRAMTLDQAVEYALGENAT